ncbi:molybdate ABC transporter substrate-binding protein [Archaeoglobus veneficus]|uniref:Extracellular solute-binding protein family 1 n=1 Tax=Archaeoglobus veneficus (strain DSM 11195 / SNP6) TaxID=693661 RepID=F2KSG5_ARCVS|nr:substrate-binding domain-containing protein [Archaeoglobus veneficus]AEA46934.1 extracellular solute-binding protein family 1 [Archaeoglobus veneficus SNP6]
MEETTKMPEIPPERIDDLHNIEYADNADLILFMAGNQFMVMDELIRAFQDEYGVERIFYETLPPGMMLKQILAGGAVFRDKIITGTPDVYSSVSEDAMKILREKGLVEDYFVYLHNRIVLMVPEGNPAGIKSVLDLARDDVRISQPNPENEDIAKYIIEMYREAGGEELVRKIMDEKRAKGTTILTLVHHRETPERIVKGEVDVGPVWATEVVYARMQGLKVDAVEPGEDIDQRDKVNYYIAKLRNSPNPSNAEKFLEFINSKKAQKIYEKYGFVLLCRTNKHRIIHNKN